MGIFSDKCQAYINPETRRVLTGKDLEEAKKTNQYPRCGNKVKKAAKFCNACGSSAPKGWWKCYSCNEYVGNDSTHCWNCNAKFQVSYRVDIGSGTWGKKDSLVAQKFDLADIGSLLSNGLTIHNSTAGAIVNDQQFETVLKSGKHTLETYLSSNSSKYSLILFDNSEILLPIHIKSLRSKEGFEIDFYGEIAVQISETNLELFISNTLKSSSEFSYEELSKELLNNIENIIEDFCKTSSMDDLISDASRRIKLYNSINDSLDKSFNNLGININYVSSAEFYGEKYEEILSQNSEIDEKRRELEREEKVREILNHDKMKKYQSEKDLEAYQLRISHEFNMNKDKIDRERDLLLEAWRKKDDLDNLKHEYEKKLFAVEEDIKISSLKGDARREEEVKDANKDVDVRKIKFSQEADETEQALKWRKMKSDMKNEDKKADLERRKNLSAVEMLSDIDDDQKRKDILEFMKLSQKSNDEKDIE